MRLRAVEEIAALRGETESAPYLNVLLTQREVYAIQIQTRNETRGYRQSHLKLLYVPSRKPLPNPLFEPPTPCKSSQVSAVRYLVLILVRLVVDNVEEAEFVHALGGGNDAEPVAKLLLLEELLGPGDTVSPAPLILPTHRR